MKTLYSVLFTVTLALTAIAGTPDYRIDTTFNAGFQTNDDVNDVLVLASGKLMVGGRLCQTGSPCTLLLRRLNSDGTVDATFNSPLTLLSNSTGGVDQIRELPNGQFIVTGSFLVNGVTASYARLDSNGGLDSTMATASIGADYVVPTPDGKYIACVDRTINGELYDIAHRLNSDGTPDPSFRVTFIRGTCRQVIVLADGKILVRVSYASNEGEPPIKPLYRLNADGTPDTSFDAAINIGHRGDGLTLLPDGKIVIKTRPPTTSTPTVRRLLPDGAEDMVSPYCDSEFFLPGPSETLLTTDCRRGSTTGTYPIEFARLFSNGDIDRRLDNVYFDRQLDGLRDAGGGKYYAYGTFDIVNKAVTPHKKLLRLEPHSTPPRAKYDFDGDGKSDFVVFRPSNGYWYLNQSTAGISYFQWGLSGDRPAAAHFDNDGKTDFAVIRTGVVHAWSSVYGHRYMNMQIDANGARPFPGNYDDAQAAFDDSFFRGIQPGGSLRKYLWSGSPGWVWFQSPDSTFGGASDELLSDYGIGADLNGDSRTDVGYFRDGVWRSGDVGGQQPSVTAEWGAAGDIPVPDDYDGDRQADYAVFRPSTGDWWINRSTEGLFVLRFGANGDIPVPADYDGDGKVDIAIHRNGQWWQYLMGTGTVQVMNWGTAGDIPIPSQSQ